MSDVPPLVVRVAPIPESHWLTSADGVPQAVMPPDLNDERQPPCQSPPGDVLLLAAARARNLPAGRDRAGPGTSGPSGGADALHKPPAWLDEALPAEAAAARS